MERDPKDYLSKRGQQIMDIVYERGRITAAELEKALPGELANATVRAQLRTLEERGHLRHFEEDGRFVYVPTRPKPSAAKAAMRRFLRTFVNGSVDGALATLLSAKETDLTVEELDRLQKVLDEARKARTEE